MDAVEKKHLGLVRKAKEAVYAIKHNDEASIDQRIDGLTEVSGLIVDSVIDLNTEDFTGVGENEN